MFISILFDIILAGLLIGGGFLGVKKGFIGAIAKPVKIILTFILAFSLAGVVSNLIVEPIIGPAVSHKMTDILVEKYSDITADTANEKLPTLIKFAASMCGVNVKDVATQADGVHVVEAIAASVTAPVVSIMGRILGFVIAYFFSKFLVGFLMKLIDNLLDKGVAGSVNKTLGCIFMVFLAFVAGWAFTSFFEFIFNIPAIAATKGIQRFNGGPIYKLFRTITPLDLLLSF